MRLATLALLTLIGGWLRFTALDFGLPDKFRPDEEYVVSRAVGFHTSANPHFTVYPAAQMYLHHGVLRLIALVEGRRGDFRRAFDEHGFARAHLVGRRLAATLGTATIPAIYWAALPAYGGPAALAGAAVLTFATIHVRESKYSTTDAPAVFWLTLALGMMLRVIRRGRRVDSLLAGVLTGVAMGTKYPTGALLAGMAAAHVGARFREGRSLWRVFRDIRPYLTLIGALVVFICVTPYLLLDWQQTLRDFDYQRSFLTRGVGNPYAGWGWSWLLTRALPDGLGPILAVALLVAVAWGMLRPRAGTWSLLVFLAVASIGIASSRYTFYRYILIPLPALALFAGITTDDARSALGRFFGDRRAALAVVLGWALLLTPCAIRDYKLNRLLARSDTRTLARRWIDKHIPKGAAIAMTHHQTPYGKPQIGGYRVRPMRALGELRREGTRWVLSDPSVLPFYSPGPTDTELRALEKGASLVFDVDPLKPGTPEPIYDQADAFYVPLRHASSVKRPGPRIRIWKIPDAAPPRRSATPQGR